VPLDWQGPVGSGPAATRIAAKTANLPGVLEATAVATAPFAGLEHRAALGTIRSGAGTILAVPPRYLDRIHTLRFLRGSLRPGEIVFDQQLAATLQVQPGDAVLLTPGDQLAGSTGSYSNVSQIRIDATASVEPDADGDGFGDETQDSCPTDPSLQSRCTSNLSMTVTADKRSVIPGSDVTFGLTVHNSGPSTSNGVQIVAELSPELRLEGTAGGNCSGGSRLTCAVADIPKDGDAVVRVVAKATTIGPASMAAKATSSTTDSDQSDNGGGITVAVVWRSGRCANTFTARAGRDVFRGTSAGDLVNGLTGNDILSGLGGADCLSGGPGNDRITGGDGNDRLSGGDGNDTIGGDAGNDSIDGGAGNDQLAGGSGADTISAGSGNDGVNAADGVRDLVDCGAGRDTVRADRRDRLKRCEKVVWVKIAPPRRHAKR